MNPSFKRLLQLLLIPILGLNGFVRAASSPEYSWHTFYGSSTWDYGYALAVDGSGNIYITGESGASWNGPANQPPLQPYTSGDDVFVLKLDANGSYQWHTFYGGDDESGEGIAVDENGGVYICGNSNTSWNGPAGQAPLNPFAGEADMLVLKLNASGAYQWHAYFGSPAADDCFDIAAKNGSIAITGVSSINWNGPSSAAPLHAVSGYGDMSLVKLNTDGAYQWHTFYSGDAAHTTGLGIDIDNAGRIIAVGETNSSWGLVTVPLHSYTGGKDIFIIQLNNAGILQWHTFFGSAQDDSANDVITDANNSILLIGSSDASWETPNSPVQGFAGGTSDMAVISLNGNGTYQWHTFYGSSIFDSGEGIDIDPDGNIIIAGYKDPSPKSGNILPYFGNGEIEVARLTHQGAFLDGQLYPTSAFDMAVDDYGNIYLTGDSSHTWDESNGNKPLHEHNGSDEVVVIKLKGPQATNIFGDVPAGYWAKNYIETLYANGITGGCTTSPLNYCPENPVTRAQMAVFLEKALHGSNVVPPNIPATFTDTSGHWAEDWIEALKTDGITSGCGAGLYCPEDSVTRAQMAVFLLKAKYGSAYAPPAVGFSGQ